ncbi:MAG: hypothetical protein RL215_1164 [Planctomycetota bacterium]|jgi:hypothetical protein
MRVQVLEAEFAAGREVSRQAEVVLYEHKLTGLEILTDTSGGICEDECLCAEGGEEADGGGDSLEGVSFVGVNAAFLKEYWEIVYAAGGEAAAMTRDVRGSESRDPCSVNGWVLAGRVEEELIGGVSKS